MKKFKWYWLIPIFGFVFLKQTSEWVFDAPTFEGRLKRDSIGTLAVLYHGLCFILLIAIIKIILGE